MSKNLKIVIYSTRLLSTWRDTYTSRSLVDTEVGADAVTCTMVVVQTWAWKRIEIAIVDLITIVDLWHSDLRLAKFTMIQS